MEKFLILLPTIIVIESLCAALVYFWCGRWGAGLYWASAGVLNFSVIYLIKSTG